MRPLTESIPKPLVPLNGKPVIEYLMNLLAAQGAKEFVVCTGYKSKMVFDAVNSFSKKDWKVDFVDSGENATILQRIISAGKLCGERFIVCYGDTVADINLNELVKVHEKNSAGVTNVLYQMESPFGVMETKDDLVIEYKEKPLLPFWFNIGFFVFEKKVLDGANGTDWIGFLNTLVKGKKLFALKHKGEHITFNTEPEKVEAEKKIKTFSYIFE